MGVSGELDQPGVVYMLNDSGWNHRLRGALAGVVRPLGGCRNPSTDSNGETDDDTHYALTSHQQYSSHYAEEIMDFDIRAWDYSGYKLMSCCLAGSRDINQRVP
jgi:hypothetical protein